MSLNIKYAKPNKQEDLSIQSNNFKSWFQKLLKLHPKQRTNEIRRCLETEFHTFMKSCKESGIKLDDNQIINESYILFLLGNDNIKEVLLSD